MLRLNAPGSYGQMCERAEEKRKTMERGSRDVIPFKLRNNYSPLRSHNNSRRTSTQSAGELKERLYEIHWRRLPKIFMYGLFSPGASRERAQACLWAFEMRRGPITSERNTYGGTDQRPKGFKDRTLYSNMIS